MTFAQSASPSSFDESPAACSRKDTAPLGADTSMETNRKTSPPSLQEDDPQARNLAAASFKNY